MLFRAITTLIYFAIAISTFAQSHYEHINLNANHIMMNGADWSNIKEIIKIITTKSDSTSTPTKLNILQIGDSHIQAGYMSEKTREILQNKFGNGGRGLLSPLRLAGTNQPEDYTITSSLRITNRYKMSKNPNLVGLTGIAIKVQTGSVLTVSTKQDDDEFNSITVFHSPGNAFSSANINGVNLTDTIEANITKTFPLNEPTSKAEIKFTNTSEYLWGINLQNNKEGIIFSAIGNNGMCYSHYNAIPELGEQIASLTPQLIIISLGTNEAFGNFSQTSILKEIDTMVSRLSLANPQAQFLLTTPMECDKRRRIGRRRRRNRYAFSTNENCKMVRNAIIKYGQENGIAVWDLYKIAGGDGSAAKWVSNSLLSSRDHIHCTIAGYQLQGKLLAEAILEQLVDKNKPNLQNFQQHLNVAMPHNTSNNALVE